jgi:hypothetical protein
MRPKCDVLPRGFRAIHGAAYSDTTFIVDFDELRADEFDADYPKDDERSRPKAVRAWRAASIRCRASAERLLATPDTEPEAELIVGLVGVAVTFLLKSHPDARVD